MQYMCLIYSNESTAPQPGTPEFMEVIQEYQEFGQLVNKDGVFEAGDALQPSVTATTVTNHNGTVATTDGPFAETKEQLGGYYLLDCENLDQAIEYASKIPTAKHGRIEVRPVMVFDN